MNFKNIIIGSLALTLAACSKNSDVDLGSEIRLENIVEAEISMAGEQAQLTYIPEGETVRVWGLTVAEATGEEFPIYNAETMTAEADGSLSGTRIMNLPPDNSPIKMNFRALHGMFDIAVNAEFPSSVDFSVAREQSPGNNAYIESDLLYGTAYRVGDQGNPTTVTLTFYHMLSKLEIRFAETSGTGETTETEETEGTATVSSISIADVALSGTFTPDIDADITQQSERAAMIAAGEETGSLDIAIAQNSAATIDAVMVPQDITGKNLTVTLSDGTQITTSAFPEGSVLKSGKRMIVSVDLANKTLVVTNPDITAPADPEEPTE